MNKLRLAVTSLILSSAIYMALVPLQSSGSAITMHGQTDAHTIPRHESAEAGSGHEPSPQQHADLNEQIQAWIDSLSKLKGFDTWKAAQWNRYPLGPGTHGWIVIVQANDQEELGYLVIHATEEGKWSLTEYGIGESPLFSMETLYRSLIQAELISDSYTWDQFITYSAHLGEIQLHRLYFSPLHAVWLVQAATESDGQPIPYYIDAKTGEQLPLQDDSFTRWLGIEVPEGLEQLASINIPMTELQEIELPVFDPFHNTYWLQGQPLDVAQFDELQLALHQQVAITYVAKLYNKQVLAPFAVTGYTVWDGAKQPFIRLEQDGSRYIPVKELFENGFFFP